MSKTRVLLATLMLVLACGKDSSGPSQGPDPVASVTVTPGSGTLMVGATVQLSVAVKNAASAVLNGRPVRWRSSNDALATVTTTGLVTAVGVGSVTITASSEGQSGTANLTLIPVPVASVTVVPATASLGSGTSSQLSAVTKDSVGGVLTGRVITWGTTNPGAVTVSPAGMVTGVGAGSATIIATSEGKSGTALITVDPTPVASVTVAPTSAQVGVAATTSLSATTRAANNQVLTGRVVAWSSSAPGVAQVDPNGVVTGVTMGQATITATSEGQSGNATVTVVAGAPASISMSPSPATVAATDTIQLSAVVLDAAGDTLSGQAIAWSSLTPSTATVNGSGRVIGVSAGTALISASNGGLSATDTVTVTQAPVSSVSVTPSSLRLGTGTSVQLSAVLKDSHGVLLTGRPVTWSSSDSSIATISPAGLLTGVAPGTVTITATSEGKSGTISIVVEIESVATVIVSPATQSVGAGLQLQMSAVTLDAAGDTLQGRIVLWSTADQSVATIDANGLLTGLVAGSTTVTGTSEGVNGTATVNVVVNLAFPALDGGFRHTCSLTSGGAAYCWGNNIEGELGTGVYSTGSAVPILVTGGVNFTALFPGGRHTCALNAAGTAYCWGDNSLGQLGQGNTSNSAAPLPVSGGLSFVALTGGFTHACGLTAAGKAYCWGDNSTGELGIGNTQNRLVPTAVSGNLVFVQLSARGAHTCGLTAAGSAYCWGSNANGELGDGTRTDRTSPVPVSGGLSFTQITTGGGHTCALASDGSAYCWGDNQVGEVGDGTLTDRLAPTLVQGGLTFQVLKARSAHTCAIASGGAAYCWGENTRGQLGDGTTTNRNLPAAVQGGQVFTDVSSGTLFSCGVTSSPLLYCWGDNTYGQLGDGSFVTSNVPVKVLGQP